MKAFSFKTLFAAGALAATLAAALPAPAAMADVHVGFGVGIYPPVSSGWNGGYDNGYQGDYQGGYGGYQGGYGGYQGGYGGYQGGYGGYQGGWQHRPRPAYDAYVSCRDGQRILWRSGYSGIEVQSCGGGFYRYTAWRKGKQFLMSVDGQGYISRLRRLY